MSAQPSVDWETAGVWAGQLTPAGSTPSRTEATELVADLRQAAHQARDLALEASGLADALAAPGAVHDQHLRRFPDRTGGGERVGQAGGPEGKVTGLVRGLTQIRDQLRRLGARRRRAGRGQLPGPHTSGLPVDGRLRAHPPTLTGGPGGELTPA